MNKEFKLLPTEFIEQSIHILRGQKVMLDVDLASLYGIETKKLNQAVKRNLERFPEDFMFRLSLNEFKNLRSQFVTSSLEYGGRRYFPYAFTEQGVAMLSSVLRSSQAIKVNIEIMRTFVRMRHLFASHQKLSQEMEEIKSFLLKNSQQNNAEFRKVWKAIEKLSEPPEEERKIGFKLINLI